MAIGTIGNVSASQFSVANVGSSFAPAVPAGTSASTAATVQTENAVQQVTAAPSLDEVKKAVQEISNSMQSYSRGLEFSIDDESNRTIVKVVDKQSQEIIRQIPTEEALAIAKSLEQTIGSLINDKA